MILFSLMHLTNYTIHVIVNTVNNTLHTKSGTHKLSQ